MIQWIECAKRMPPPKLAVLAKMADTKPFLAVYRPDSGAIPWRVIESNADYCQELPLNGPAPTHWLPLDPGVWGVEEEAAITEKPAFDFAKFLNEQAAKIYDPILAARPSKSSAPGAKCDTICPPKENEVLCMCYPSLDPQRLIVHYKCPMHGAGGGGVEGTTTEEAPPPKPQSILLEAEKLIQGEKRAAYGDVTESFAQVADYWETIFNIPIKPQQVALAMVFLKLQRELHRHKRDSLVDAAGYLALAQQIEDEANSNQP